MIMEYEHYSDTITLHCYGGEHESITATITYQESGWWRMSIDGRYVGDFSSKGKAIEYAHAYANGETA